MALQYQQLDCISPALSVLHHLIGYILNNLKIRVG